MSPTMRVSEIPSATETAPDRRPGASVNVIVWRFGAERAARAFHQVGLDEAVDVAVEHAVDVANLFLRSLILDESIRREHVAADLTAEGDLLLGAANLIELGLLFFQLEVVESRLQDLHRRVAIAVLGAFVLTRHDDARRQVRDAN